MPKSKSTKTRERKHARVHKVDAIPRTITALARVVPSESVKIQPFAHGTTQSIFSKVQQEIVSEPAKDHELDVRPDNGAVYMPHVHIRRRLSRAFDVGGWRLLPAPGPGGAPQRQPQGRKADN